MSSTERGRGPILVIEDDAEICDAIHDTLAWEGYDAIEVRDGQAALDYLGSNPPPPLILLDWNMAPMNGAEFMAEVAKDASLSTVPVVLLTAEMRAQETIKGRQFVGHLKKPVDLDALFEIVGRYCARSVG
jgi:CheY-like chemotaxis protein